MKKEKGSESERKKKCALRSEEQENCNEGRVHSPFLLFALLASIYEEATNIILFILGFLI